MAAGCSGSQTASVNSQSGGSEQPSGQTQAQIGTSVQVKGADDAASLIEKASANEQSQVSAGSDSDLTASDSADLSSMTEVQNGY